MQRAEARLSLAEPVGRPRPAALVLAIAKVHRALLPMRAAEPLPRLPWPAEGRLGGAPGVLAQAVLVIDLAFLLVSGAPGCFDQGTIGRRFTAVWGLARQRLLRTAGLRRAGGAGRAASACLCALTAAALAATGRCPSS